MEQDRILKEFEFSNNWTVKIDGNYTFFGVLHDYWDNTSEHWKAESTRKSYLRDYDLYILPNLDNIALKDCDRDVFDDILASLQKSASNLGRVYNESVFRHIQLLIMRVLNVAEANNVCTNVLWGTEYAISENGDDEQSYRDELVVLRKSLTVHEEILIRDQILFDHQQQGEYFGLALMFCLGLRNNEACGADFGDIHPFDCDSNYYGLWVYKSTAKGTNVMRYGGKTRNVSRIIPMPSLLVDLLKKRREYLLTELTKFQSENQTSIRSTLEEHIDSLPIAGVGKFYDTRCSAPDLTKAGAMLLKDIKLKQEMLALIDRDIRRPGRTEEGITEKDPTAYLFRRNLGTHLYLLGLEDSEIQYILAHEIEDENDERSFFRNEEKLYPIAKKMAMRPVVNLIDNCPEDSGDSLSSVYQDMHHIRLHLPTDKSLHHKIVIRQREPFSTTKVSIESASGSSFQGTLTQSPNPDPYSNTLSITTDYHNSYQKQLRKSKTP